MDLNGTQFSDQLARTFRLISPIIRALISGPMNKGKLSGGAAGARAKRSNQQQLSISLECTSRSMDGEGWWREGNLNFLELSTAGLSHPHSATMLQYTHIYV